MTDFAGTGAMIRLALRRDRIIIPVWITGFVAMAAVSTSATVSLFPTVASRVAEAASLNSAPSLVAMYGRIYDPTSLGEVAMIKMGGFGSAMLAVLSIILVVRHTRAEEESGRLELLGATVVGRFAPLTAALAVVVLTDVVIAGLTAIAVVATGLPVGGSIAFGLAWLAVGVAFAAAAGIAAQLSRNARTATAMSIAFLGFVYILRGIGDSSDADGLSWLSPIGWGQQVRPYAGERLWVLIVPLAFVAAAVATAYVLAARRDLGAGIIPDRPGPARAAAGLDNPFALAWRMHRAPLLWWTIGFAALGYVFGNIASSVGTMLDSPQAQEWIMRIGGKQGLTDAFLATELSMMGMVASAYGVQAMLRLRSEETAVRAEPLLATGSEPDTLGGKSSHDIYPRHGCHHHDRGPDGRSRARRAHRSVKRSPPRLRRCGRPVTRAARDDRNRVGGIRNSEPVRDDGLGGTGDLLVHRRTRAVDPPRPVGDGCIAVHAHSQDAGSGVERHSAGCVDSRGSGAGNRWFRWLFAARCRMRFGHHNRTTRQRHPGRADRKVA